MAGKPSDENRKRYTTASVKVVAASGNEELLPALIDCVKAIGPDLPVYVFSESPPPQGHWIPYHPARTFRDNLALCRWTLREKSIYYSVVLLEPRTPYWRMRLIGLLLNSRRLLLFNENLDYWSPRSVPAMLRHCWWRAGNFLRAERPPGERWRDLAARALMLMSGLAVAALKGLLPRTDHLPPAPHVFPDGDESLRRAFTEVPDLFAATRPQTESLPGEDLTYVLYGLSGHTLYSPEKLRLLQGDGASDAELGYRAWLQGWPTVRVGTAAASPPLAATAADQLRFLARSIVSPRLFLRLWREQAIREPDLWKVAWRAPLWVRPGPRQHEPEEPILALASGHIAVFPGRKRQGRKVVVIASPYLPFPLAHGGAVRMWNLLRRSSEDYDIVLVTFCDQLASPDAELLSVTSEVVLVQRVGSHLLRSTHRPDVVEEFDSPAYHAALRQTVRKWRPSLVQLEFTQMAQYASAASSAKTILVEHDLTFDFQRQLLKVAGDDWEIRRQAERWERFERDAWQRVDCVVTMSEEDRQLVQGSRAVSIPNGVDLHHYQPSAELPDEGRLLFVGPLSHLPNLLALEYFFRDVWPLLADEPPTLQIVAGRHWQRHANLHLDRDRVEVFDYVEDLRPLYRTATLVIAPLTVSAGTKIKVLEAMAMGKAIVGTTGAFRGLDLGTNAGVRIGHTAGELAVAILELLRDSGLRRQLEQQARSTVEKRFGWDQIWETQRQLYEVISPHSPTSEKSNARKPTTDC